MPVVPSRVSAITEIKQRADFLEVVSDGVLVCRGSKAKEETGVGKQEVSVCKADKAPVIKN